MDENYINLVASLLEGENSSSLPNNASATNLFVGMDSNGDDFLPMTEFLVRDRAYSWDLSLESSIHDLESTITNSVNEIAKSNINGSKLTNINSHFISNRGVMISSLSNASIEYSMVPDFYGNPHMQQEGDINYQADSYYSQMSNSLPLRKRTYSDEFKAVIDTDSVREYFTVMPNIERNLLCPPISYEERPDGRIGAYTKDERKAIIEKFRAKKLKRVWRKQIKYDCRKRLADTRPRVKGRFVSRKEGDGDEDSDDHLSLIHSISSSDSASTGDY